jgi:uncharacterized protein
MAHRRDNPFRLSGAVTGKDFANREAERAKIRAALTQQQHYVLVYGPRRMGKTSTLRVVQDELRSEGHPVVLADLSTASSAVDMTHRLLRAVATDLGRTLKDAALAIARRMKFEVTFELDPISGVPIPKIGGALRDAPPETQRESFADALDAIEQLATERRTRVGIILDEFQEIHRFGGEVAEAQLRGVMQHHTHVSYVLAGSDERLIQAMLGPRRPFYKMLNPLWVGPIDPVFFARWIDRKMHGAGGSSAVGRSIVERAGPRTRDIVQLAYEVYERGPASGPALVDLVNAAFADIVASEDAPTRVLWAQLSPLQQNVLRAVAVDGIGLTTAERRRQFSLGATGAATKAAQVLVERDILVKEENGYAFDSPFMRGWVQANALGDVL